MENDPDWNPIRNIILPDAKRQPDRSLAVVLAAVVEDHLGEVIINRLVNDKRVADRMFTGLGPLSSFSAKIDMGFLLGLYGEEGARMLHAVRRIRNLFAHDMNPIDFNTQQVGDIAEPLGFINTFYPHDPREGRELYIGACEFMMGMLGALGSDKRRFRSPQRGKAPSGKIE